MSLDPVPLSPGSTSGLSQPMAARPLVRRAGVAGLALAALAIVLEVVAISVGSGGAWGAASVLAWFVIALQAVSLVLGVVAILTGHGRPFGLAAVVLSLLGNPLVLVGLFSLLRGLS